MDDEVVIIRLARPTGLRFGGFSSSYAVIKECLPQLLNAGLFTEEEVYGIVANVNEVITTFWPCVGVYLCCYVLPCCPNLCVAKAEEAAHAQLNNTSLSASYYDRRIRFRLVKTWWYSSFVVVEIPQSALRVSDIVPSLSSSSSKTLQFQSLLKEE